MTEAVSFDEKSVSECGRVVKILHQRDNEKLWVVINFLVMTEWCQDTFGPECQ